MSEIEIIDATGSNSKLIYLIETQNYSEDLRELIKLIEENSSCVHDTLSDGYTALHFAAWDGNTDVVKLLIEQGAKVDNKGLDGFTPFLLAASNGHYSSTVILVDNGANINHLANSDEDTRGLSGVSAIRMAAINQEWNIVDYLISKNVSLDTLKEPCLGKPGGYENLIDVIRHFGKTNENVIHNEKKLQELEKLIKP